MERKVSASDQHRVDRGFKLGIRTGSKIIVGPHAGRLKQAREKATEGAGRNEKPSV
jgi:hypothetical protein